MAARSQEWKDLREITIRFLLDSDIQYEQGEGLAIYTLFADSFELLISKPWHYLGGK